MIRISGVCDDLIKIDGTIYYQQSVNIDNDEWLEIVCSDGTEAEICFSSKAFWKVNVLKRGRGYYGKADAISRGGNYGSHVEEAEGCRPYSDVLLLDDSCIEWVRLNGVTYEIPKD